MGRTLRGLPYMHRRQGPGGSKCTLVAPYRTRPVRRPLRGPGAKVCAKTKQNKKRTIRPVRTVSPQVAFAHCASPPVAAWPRTNPASCSTMLRYMWGAWRDRSAVAWVLRAGPRYRPTGPCRGAHRGYGAVSSGPDTAFQGPPLLMYMAVDVSNSARCHWGAQCSVLGPGQAVEQCLGARSANEQSITEWQKTPSSWRKDLNCR